MLGKRLCVRGMDCVYSVDDTMCLCVGVCYISRKESWLQAS